MKWIPLLTSLPALMLCAAQEGEAGLMDRLFTHQQPSGCDCAPTMGCKPIIQRPCHRNVYTYQRQAGCQKPLCCDSSCAPSITCGPACGPMCESTMPCSTACDAGCCPNAPCCDLPMRDDCCLPNCEDISRLAALVHESQSACYPKERRKAIHRLGDQFACDHHPEVMDALLHALNDSDPFVRRKAADEIGDQIKKCQYCCNDQIVPALRCALADCDRGTRKQAEQALKRCGYEVVDACSSDCCPFSWVPFYGAGDGSESRMNAPEQSSPRANEEDAPLPPDVAPPGTDPASYLPPTLETFPAPPLEPSASFRTKREFMESKARPSKGRTGLAGLFGLAK